MAILVTFCCYIFVKLPLEKEVNQMKKNFFLTVRCVVCSLKVPTSANLFTA